MKGEGQPPTLAFAPQRFSRKIFGPHSGNLALNSGFAPWAGLSLSEPQFLHL